MGEKAKEPIYPSLNFYRSNIGGRRSLFRNIKHDLEKGIYHDGDILQLKQYYFYRKVSVVFSNDWLYEPSFYFSESFLGEFPDFVGKIEEMRNSDTFRLEKFEMPEFIKANQYQSFYLVGDDDISKMKTIMAQKAEFLKRNFPVEYDLLSNILTLLEKQDVVFIFR